MTATCKTCRWWGGRGTSKSNYDSLGLPVDTDFRPCMSPIAREIGPAGKLIGLPGGVPAGLMPHLRKVAVVFGPDFGCVHHEEKRDG